MARNDVRLKDLSLEFEELAGRLSALALEKAPGPPSLSPSLARLVLAVRLMWAGQFETGLGEPARNMLLALYAARLESQRFTPTKLAFATAVPLPTALHWLNVMVERGLIRRSGDRRDRRLVRLTLTAGAVAGIEAYLAAVFERPFLLPRGLG
jgi:DNA-binding transcriptional ArsR family regulator